MALLVDYRTQPAVRSPAAEDPAEGSPAAEHRILVAGRSADHHILPVMAVDAQATRRAALTAVASVDATLKAGAGAAVSAEHSALESPADQWLLRHA